MRRREFITLLGGAAAWSLAARAQQGKVWRIGMLDTAPREFNGANMNAFLQGLRKLGYIEGRNLAIDYRTAGERSELLPGLVTELLRLKPDVLAVRGTPEAMAIKNATGTVPGGDDGGCRSGRLRDRGHARASGREFHRDGLLCGGACGKTDSDGEGADPRGKACRRHGGSREFRQHDAMGSDPERRADAPHRSPEGPRTSCSL
jgi:hypothetical protein